MKRAHGVAAGLYEQEWKDAVQQAGDARQDHAASEPARASHVLQIGLTHGKGVVDEEPVDHGGLANLAVPHSNPSG